MEIWAILLIVLAALVAAVFLVSRIIKAWAISAYKRIKKNPPSCCDIDAFVGPDNPVDATKVVLAHKIQLGNRQASLEPIPLEFYMSTHVDNLHVSRKQSDVATGPPTVTVMTVDQLFAEGVSKNKKPIIIATIRMGFGHHRLAYSAASWAIQTGHPTVFHDLLNVTSRESDLIKTTDELYSKFSRLASEMGGAMEKVWGKFLLSADSNALRIAANTAAHLQPLLSAFPHDTPIITTHQLCALTAAAVGFTNVVNLVVDNHPQWFLTVPKTLNLMQGPVNYESFLRMGVRPEECKWAGHWCPYDLVTNVPIDCQRRIDRRNSKPFKPIRLLIPVGGAGAQRKFIISFVKELSDHVKAGKVQLFLNAGDHKHMKAAFLETFDECGLDFDIVSDTAGVKAFQKSLLDPNAEPNKGITLFAFDEYFPAVATTDILCRVTDVLSCKPSELAFYCVPKLHIRRVGDHEADSAKRSSELGDGTLEAREVSDAMAYVRMFFESPDLLISMNDAITKNNSIGIYNGCQRAVEYAIERSS